MLWKRLVTCPSSYLQCGRQPSGVQRSAITKAQQTVSIDCLLVIPRRLSDPELRLPNVASARRFPLQAFSVCLAVMFLFRQFASFGCRLVADGGGSNGGTPWSTVMAIAVAFPVSNHVRVVDQRV